MAEDKRQVLTDSCSKKIDELSRERDELSSRISLIEKIPGSSFAHKDSSKEFKALEVKAAELGVFESKKKGSKKAGEEKS